MSGRVCYLARADRGDRPALVRLAGAGSDHAWAEFSATDAPGIRAEIEAAAMWLAERASRGDGPRHEIELLIVDAEGSACAWVTSPSSDAVVVGAALSGEDGDWSRVTERAESTVQALAEPVARPARRTALAEDSARKMAVMLVPDIPARLLADALDARGIAVVRIASLWQALAQAWDPAGPAASGDTARGEVVARSSPVSAAVMIDPAGRLVWSWSRDGELLTGGTVRIAPERRDEPAPEGRHPPAAGLRPPPVPVRVGPAEIGRLTTDWLAWSIQLGVAPARIVCIGPDTEDPADPDAMSPAAIGAALTRAWPGATVDLAVHDDPIGATLARLARADTPGAGASEDGPRSTLLDLTRRPGRAHRSMYRWAAAAILALAALLLGLGWQAWSQATSERAAQKAAVTGVREAVVRVGKPKGDFETAEAERTPREYLQKKINDKRLSLNPTGGLAPAKPILTELDTLAFVIGSSPGTEIEEIHLLPTNAVMYLYLPDTPTFEGLVESLRSVGGQHIEWRGRFGADIGAKKRYAFEGAWRKAEARAAGGSAP